ncbi:MAG: cation transporter [Acetobacteraceae bacterium]|nr:cation transporter [Acetobacteraceae bacterium]
MGEHDPADPGCDHGHAHAFGVRHPVGSVSTFAIGTVLNVGFIAAEVAFGLAANSVALLADAVHNLGDVLGLAMAWAAALLMRRPPTGTRTYGWGRSSILAAVVNSAVLLIGVGAITVEALRRLLSPQPVSEAVVVWVAAGGIVINGVTALLFMRGRTDDLNIRAAFVHFGGDAAVAAGVVAAGLLIGLTGWVWLDPVASLAVAAVVVAASLSVLAESTDLALDAVPRRIALREVEAFLRGLPGVVEVHDLHIWAISTTETALTAHLVCAESVDPHRVGDIAREIRHRFRIGHTTLQIESRADAEACRLRPADVV